MKNLRFFFEKNHISSWVLPHIFTASTKVGYECEISVRKLNPELYSFVLLSKSELCSLDCSFNSHGYYLLAFPFFSQAFTYVTFTHVHVMPLFIVAKGYLMAHKYNIHCTIFSIHDFARNPQNQWNPSIWDTTIIILWDSLYYL